MSEQQWIAERRIEDAIDRGIDKIDLYAIANEDILQRKYLSAFFRAALKAYLQSLVAEVGQQK